MPSPTEGDVGRRGKKRVASSAQPVEVQPLPCINGGFLGKPVVVPLDSRRGGAKVVTVKTTTSWLHGVLSGKLSSQAARTVIVNVLEDVRAEYTRDSTDQMIEDIEQRDAQEQERNMGLDDESSSDHSDAPAPSEPKKKAQRSTKKKKAGAICVKTVTLMGIGVEVARAGKQMELVWSFENIKSFVDICLNYAVNEAKKHSKKKKAVVHESSGTLKDFAPATLKCYTPNHQIK